MESRLLRARIGTSQRLISRAHSLLKIRVAKRSLAKRTFGLKNWHPVKTNHRRSSRVCENSCEPTDKSRAAGVPLWIISLDLSKAFHTVNWEHAVGSFASTKNFKPIDLDFTVPLFFSTRLFGRRTFSSKDCFTGQSPGMLARTMLAIFIPAAPGCA